MKKRIIGLVGVALTVMGLSVNQAQGATAECKAHYDLAYNVMKLRQDNAPRELVESVVNSDDGMLIIDKAYRKAIVPQQHRQTVSRTYAEHVMVACERSRMVYRQPPEVRSLAF